MARTRFVPRRRLQNMNFDQRRTAAAKEIANHRRMAAKNIKIKMLLPQSKDVDVKQRGVVARRMTVCRKSIFPAKLETGDMDKYLHNSETLFKRCFEESECTMIN